MPRQPNNGNERWRSNVNNRNEKTVTERKERWHLYRDLEITNSPGEGGRMLDNLQYLPCPMSRRIGGPTSLLNLPHKNGSLQVWLNDRHIQMLPLQRRSSLLGLRIVNPLLNKKSGGLPETREDLEIWVMREHHEIWDMREDHEIWVMREALEIWDMDMIAGLIDLVMTDLLLKEILIPLTTGDRNQVLLMDDLTRGTLMMDHEETVDREEMVVEASIDRVIKTMVHGEVSLKPVGMLPHNEVVALMA